MNKLSIAIQKSGRLSEDSLKLLKDCGIEISHGQGKLKTEAQNFPLEIFFLRDDDIPQYVQDGVADLGIVGENVLLEKNKQVRLIEPLGFGKCRLSLALPKNSPYEGLSSLQGQRIATSYPNILGQYLAAKGVEAELHELSGSVEIAPSIGLAEAICDLVSSGSTLLTNGLREVECILQSQAVLIAKPDLSAEQQTLLNKLCFRIHALKAAKKHKYILLNAPNDQIERITQILPGMKSPSVLPLAMTGWSSLHSVIEEDDFWEIIEQLKEAGAQGILVVPIEKMIL